MRLYLSSDRTGCCFEDLVHMAGRKARAAVISNALDLVPMEARQAYAGNVFDPIAHFAEYDIDAFHLDLRRYFGRANDLNEVLKDVAVVWMVGGETFLLASAVRASGLGVILQRRLAEDSLVYGGWSAGAILAGPSLHGAELMDNAAAVAAGYPPGETIWEGLDLIDVHLVPHYRSGHAEGPAAEAMAAFYEAEGLPYETLREGDVMLVNGPLTEIRRAPPAPSAPAAT